MGACGSSESAGSPGSGPSGNGGGGGPTMPVDAKEVSASARIDKQLRDENNKEEDKVKFLLLGAGESGKSTIFKQMRILYGTPRNDEELRMYGVIVRANIIVAVRKLLLLMKHLKLEDMLDDESFETKKGEITPREAYDRLNETMSPTANQPSMRARDFSQRSFNGSGAPELPQDAAQSKAAEESANVGKDWVGQSPRAGFASNEDAKLFLKHWELIRVFWKSKTMKELWPRRAQANIIDGHKDYFQDIQRIAAPHFRPTNPDILNARVKTTTVSMERYLIDEIYFELYDVGGQRSERRKWMECFDSVDAVIFVAALSEYDQSLAESRKTNRMVEALDLFRSVANNRAFKKTSVMLFLNKKDVFAEKIMYSHIADQPHFVDFAGDRQNFDEGVLYFIQKFKECRVEGEYSDSYIHVTCATDTNNMEFVLDSTRTIVMTQNLRQSGFLGH